jgi:hypothetical protein
METENNLQQTNSLPLTALLITELVCVLAFFIGIHITDKAQTIISGISTGNFVALIAVIASIVIPYFILTGNLFNSTEEEYVFRIALNMRILVVFLISLVIIYTLNLKNISGNMLPTLGGLIFVMLIYFLFRKLSGMVKNNKNSNEISKMNQNISSMLSMATITFLTIFIVWGLIFIYTGILNQI